MATRTETSEYRFTHGRAPRGRGLWSLELHGTTPDGRAAQEVRHMHGTLAQARKLVIAAAKHERTMQTVHAVVVLP